MLDGKLDTLGQMLGIGGVLEGHPLAGMPEGLIVRVDRHRPLDVAPGAGRVAELRVAGGQPDRDPGRQEGRALECLRGLLVLTEAVEGEAAGIVVEAG